ncbi:putative sugar lactone lactonase YvrE [Belonocnema kinseyi]|uniref:putative sugar lactone lactonase YvrE n=1 Tax=Belonocnema kinseyi TaxID=2817044 RepID=UPI00143DDCB7|nr:putative sugar lactone lactonase YvrE [Belonocnema kinseyi]
MAALRSDWLVCHVVLRGGGYKADINESSAEKQAREDIRQGLLSFAVPVKHHPDKFVVGCGTNILIIKWDSSTHAGSCRHYFLKSPHQPPHDPLPEGNRVSFGTVDSSEKLWFATTNDNPEYSTLNLGSVYYLDQNTILEKKISALPSVTGGFVGDHTFTEGSEHSPPDRIYYADTLNHEIIGYDVTIEHGSLFLERREVVFNFLQHGVRGSPGRIAIDTGGSLWVPLLGGGGVIEFNPIQQRVVQFIRIPAAQVGACTFGGHNWETLYVSTIRYEFKEPHGQRPPRDKGGHLYAIHGLGVRGVPTSEYILNKRVLFEAFAFLDNYRPNYRRRRDSTVRGSSGEGNSGTL